MKLSLPPKIKAVAFDLDGTLIDFMKMKKETARAAAKAMVKAGVPATETTVYRQIFATYDEKGIEYQKTFSVVLKKYHLTRNGFQKALQAAIIAYHKTKIKVLKPYPGVKQMLRRLRQQKIKLALLTDAPREKAWQRLHLSGLSDLFDVVITYDDTKRHKPHALPFKKLLKKLGCKPQEVMMIGDNPKRDVAGAKKAGIKSFLVKRWFNGFKNKRAGP